MFHRAGRFLRSVRIVDARARIACSIADTKCLSSRRTQSVFHRAGGFIHSVARRTREHAASVLWLLLSANWQHNRNTQTRVCSGTSTDRLCLFPRLPAIPDVKPFPTDAVRRSSILLLCFCFRFCFCLCFGTFRIRWYTVVYGRMHWGATACHGVRSYTVVDFRSSRIVPHRFASTNLKKPKSCNRAHFMCADAAFCFPIFAPKKPVFHQIVRKNRYSALALHRFHFFKKAYFTLHSAQCAFTAQWTIRGIVDITFRTRRTSVQQIGKGIAILGEKSRSTEKTCGTKNQQATEQ